MSHLKLSPITGAGVHPVWMPMINVYKKPIARIVIWITITTSWIPLSTLHLTQSRLAPGSPGHHPTYPVMQAQLVPSHSDPGTDYLIPYPGSIYSTITSPHTPLHPWPSRASIKGPDPTITGLTLLGLALHRIHTSVHLPEHQFLTGVKVFTLFTTQDH